MSQNSLSEKLVCMDMDIDIFNDGIPEMFMQISFLYI